MIWNRRPILVWLGRVLAVLALAGCGAGASAQTSHRVPIEFPDLGYRSMPPHVPNGTAPGTALVVDLTNTAQARPLAMQLASDATLSGARWTNWGDRSTTAYGTATIRICTPSCGGGRDVPYRATVVLSALKSCRGYRFYQSATVTMDTVKGPRRWPAVLRAPC